MAKKNVITYLLELEDKVSAELKKTSKQAEDLEAELKQLRDEQKKGKKADERRAQALAGLKAGFAAAAVAAAAAGAGFAAMGAHAIGTSANLEGFETRLGGLLGGLDKGKARVEELFELSAKTPFSINGLVEAEATLEAFGVNASKVRGGVMDLAGAMGMDVTEAANAVGKALAGGAGAADQLREKGVLAMVEMDAGMATAEMSADQFREALVNTLETNAKLAGGTERLAETFDGLMSTLRDQFTVFSKQVGDANLFATAKATVKAILELLGDNKEETAGFASVVGGALSKALVGVVDIAFKFAAVIMRIREGWLTVKQVVYAVAIAITEMFQSMFDGMSGIPLVGDSFKSAADSMASGIASMNSNFAATADEVDKARDAQNKLLTTGDNLVNRIGELAGEYQKAADASKNIATPKASDEIMTMVGVDTKAVKKSAAQAKKAQKELDQFAKALERMGAGFSKQAAGTREPLKASEKLQAQLQAMANKFGEASMKAQNLGPEAVAAFDKVKGGMIASMSEMAAAIPAAQKQEQKEQRAAIAEGIGAGVSGATDIMSTGGMGLLGSAGPMGGAAAGLIGMGQSGDAEYQSQVADAAKEIAAERQKEMQAEADKLKAAGASEEVLAQQGLSSEDIAAAGEVTAADTAQAEKGIDRDDVMSDMVTGAVESVIEGIKGILSALPDMISALLPVILIDLPMALLDMIPKFIEEIIPVLIFDLPAALLKMAFKLIPKLVVAIFRDIPVAIFKGFKRGFKSIWKAIKDFFSFGFQTGGFIPKTGQYLLHQGERVVPSSGAGTGTATKGLGAFNTGGTSLTINTMTMSPDAVPDLGRLIDAELGSGGRTTVPIFG